MWFIRPKFKSETAKKQSAQSATKTTTKTTAKKKTTSKKKKQKLTVSKNTINYNMANRGYNPKGIVLHNDAGRSTGKQYENSLANAGYNRFVNGIAHAYTSEGYVWEAIPDGKVAWHTGDGTGRGTGNHEYYGEEIQSMSASDAQFLKMNKLLSNMQQKNLRNGNCKLIAILFVYMEFVPTACPHRSMKLHTGWDPVKQGRPSQATMIKLKDYFIKQIRAYMDGKVPTATVAKGTSASSNTNQPLLAHGNVTVMVHGI